MLAALQALWRLVTWLPPLAAWRLVHEASRLLPPPRPRADGGGAPWRFLGYELRSPMGTAAGLDKDATMVWLPLLLGLGFHVVGSVIDEPWPGVEPKLLARLGGGATLNRLGLPSRGARYVARRLAALKRALAESGVRLAVSAISRKRGCRMMCRHAPSSAGLGGGGTDRAAKGSLNGSLAARLPGSRCAASTTLTQAPASNQKLACAP